MQTFPHYSSSFIKPILCITTVQIAEQVETHKKHIHTPCQPETPAVSSGHSETKAWSCRKCKRSCRCFQTRTSVGREWDEDWGRWLGRTQGINICKGKEKERHLYSMAMDTSWMLPNSVGFSTWQEGRQKGYSYSKEILMQSMERELSSSSFLWLWRETWRCMVAMSVTYFMLNADNVLHCKRN